MNEDLRRECQTFTRYLLGTDPTEYICAQYERAHAARGETRAPASFDRALVQAAGKHPWLARLADSYAVVFRRRGTLRQKLVLLLAILESTKPTAAVLDAADGAVATILSGAVRGCLFPIWLLVGLIIFTPVRLMSSIRGA